MNKHLVLFATAFIFLFSSSAYSAAASDSEKQHLRELMSGGWNATEDPMDCSAATPYFEQIIKKYSHLRVFYKENFDYVDKVLSHCSPKGITKHFNLTWFESHGKDLSGFLPPSLSSGDSHKVVKEITDKLRVPVIQVYDMPGLSDALAIKPAFGTMPIFKDTPQFEGVIVDSKYMDTAIDIGAEDIPKDISDMDPANPIFQSFMGSYREKKYGVLAHEVAHMLLPADLQGFYATHLHKSDIQENNARVKKVLENVHDAISEGKLNRSYGLSLQLLNEMAADYVTGGILAYMGVSEKGLVYMLKMHDVKGVERASFEDMKPQTHLRSKERIKYIEMGYQARSVE